MRDGHPDVLGEIAGEDLERLVGRRDVACNSAADLGVVVRGELDEVRPGSRRRVGTRAADVEIA
jgi:hypothetical protein